jgi:hypothetical protein
MRKAVYGKQRLDDVKKNVYNSFRYIAIYSKMSFSTERTDAENSYTWSV